MEQTLYYALLDDESFGPFLYDTIIEMHLTPDILVLSTDTNEWKEASDYPELIGSLDLSLYETRDSCQYDSEHNENTRKAPPSFNKHSIFYIRKEDTPYGPYNLEALASVPLSEDTDVSLDGMYTWYKAYEISGLLNTLTTINGKKNTQQESQSVEQDDSKTLSLLVGSIQELVPSNKQLFKRVFSTKEAELDFYISEYSKIFQTLLDYIKGLCNISTDSLPRRTTCQITSMINEAVSKINNHYMSVITGANNDKSEFTSSNIYIGNTQFFLLPPFENLEINRIDFLSVLGNKNLYITYDNASENKALDFLNSIVGKLYKSNPAQLIVTNVIDTNCMNGLNDSFKLLNRDFYGIFSRNDDVRNILLSLQERAGYILRNLLVEKGSTLHDYNRTHDNKEANILLVFKDFPQGLTTDTLDILKKLVNVGPKVGIYTIILTSKEDIDDITERDSDIFDLTEFAKHANSYHFKENNSNIFNSLENTNSYNLLQESVHFDILSDSKLRDIVMEFNSRSELKEDVVVSIDDYLPKPAEWWSSNSTKQIEIPFGIGNDMHVKSLKITQESGQNTALVIGIPGSGKSVFLHSLVCSAATKYSPDELRMYLIDFSGVEFNSYALGKLPHARVIAPEAEREFGLSILNELVEEGSRRMALCRDNNVSNIVDLKHVAPEIKIPRLLVIIDEFQKFYEVDNDPIAKEANTKIHIIIQEFRKFGINLILATQKLPTTSLLPRDLIANRIVFKSAPNDFDSLITSENHSGMPRLRTGQCVYNSESGATYANEFVQGFFTSKNDIDSLMLKLHDFERDYSYDREPLKVFRSAVLPDFENRRLAQHHTSVSPIPYIVPIYIGESIAVNDIDVNVELVKENANNVLIIGGEAEIARRITFNAMRSAVAIHTENTARVVFLSGMRSDNHLNQTIVNFCNTALCDTTIVSSTAEVEMALEELRVEIELRRNDETVPQQHIYVTCLDFQSIRALDKDTSGSMPKLSAAAKNMDVIIRNGASVGIFIIAQTDSLEAINRVSLTSLLPLFNFRIALQMSEDLSYKIINSPLANKLFVFNRPSSRFRGYIRDNVRNQTIKFKPYK